jgi:amino acid transporter
VTTEVSTTTRKLGLFEATGIGVGAIVGGGILALAGSAFEATGPSALLAFALNGVIALLTALSFAELSSAFPRSGGTYLFAKRVLGVGPAFNVGWVVWFASIVAAALYAMGLAAFGLGAVAAGWADAPAWLTADSTVIGGALASLVACTAVLSHRPGSGGAWINVIKVLVFAILIGGGFVVWLRDRPPAIDRLTPFLANGPSGLASAMGYTFIALQGFDLIAAVAGEVDDPRRTLPRSMLISLGIALAVYLPLLLLIPVVGVPAGGSLDGLLADNPDTVVATAARTYLGTFGFWLVMLAGILAMLSALLANLYAASRIAQAMARDRTLPAVLDRIAPRTGTPRVALWVTAAVACLIPVVVGDVGSAGAASSLIFLVTFAMAHGICILARARRPHDGFKVPFWPVLPALGLLTCGGLAIFQGLSVPAAGAIAGVWLGLGLGAWLWLFARRARVMDAASEAMNPELLELRGRSPLVMVPVANPASALALARLATFFTPQRAGRVLLLNVVRPPGAEHAAELDGLAAVLGPSLSTCLQAGVRVEALATVSGDPWGEIGRVARAHRCEGVLLGMTDLTDDTQRQRIERLAGRLPGAVVILRAPSGWKPESVQKVLVPIGGRGANNVLRARLLAGLYRHLGEGLGVRYMLVQPSSTPEAKVLEVETLWSELVADEAPPGAKVEVTRSDEVGGAIVAAADQSDLVILGLNQVGDRPVFGNLVTRVVSETNCAVLVIGQPGTSGPSLRSIRLRV